MNWRRLMARTEIEVAASTDIGPVRSENQDAYGHFTDGLSDGEAVHLFIVADGMGGHAHGREASHTAVEAVQERFFARPDLALAARLEEAVQEANARVYARWGGVDERERCGTTCTALAWTRGEGVVAHVGDSRAYRIRNGAIDLLTKDHTWVAEMLREGILTEEEARRHPRRTALTRVVGGAEEVQVDLVELGPAQPRDVVLLCSDGLAPVALDDIPPILRKYSLQEASNRLVQLANESGGSDNVTVLLVHFG